MNTETGKKHAQRYICPLCIIITRYIVNLAVILCRHQNLIQLLNMTPVLEPSQEKTEQHRILPQELPCTYLCRSTRGQNCLASPFHSKSASALSDSLNNFSSKDSLLLHISAQQTTTLADLKIDSHLKIYTCLNILLPPSHLCLFLSVKCKA